MTNAEMVTDFALTDATPRELCTALNGYLVSLDLAADEYNFSAGTAPAVIPKWRRIVAFAVEGGSEGYYVHVGTIAHDDKWTTIGLAKTYSSDNAYAICTAAARFLAAAQWN